MKTFYTYRVIDFAVWYHFCFPAAYRLLAFMTPTSTAKWHLGRLSCINGRQRERTLCKWQIKKLRLLRQRCSGEGNHCAETIRRDHLRRCGRAIPALLTSSSSASEHKRKIKLEAQSMEAERGLLWPVLSAAKGHCRDKQKKEPKKKKTAMATTFSSNKQSANDPESPGSLLTAPHPRIRVTSSFLRRSPSPRLNVSGAKSPVNI